MCQNDCTNTLLSLKDCETILENYFGPKHGAILDYKVRNYSETIDGFLGEHLTLEIECQCVDSIKVHQFFVKTFPKNDLQGKFVLSINGFTREIETSKLLRDFQELIPNYKVDFAPKFCLGKGNDLVVFEDIRLKGYTSIQQPTNSNILDLLHIELALKSLAKLHAGSLIFEELKSQNGKAFKISSRIDSNEPMFRKEKDFLGEQWAEASHLGVKTLVDLVRRGNAEDLKQKIDDLHDKSFDIMKPSTKFRNVLCHGDLWCNNLMYKYKKGQPVHCLLIDYQFAKYYPPAHDVLVLIMQTTSRKMRQHHFHDLLHYYYTNLKKYLYISGLDIEKLIPYDEFRLSVNYYLPQVKLQVMYQLSTTQGDKQYIKELSKDIKKFETFLFEDRSEAIRILIDIDSRFRFLMLECLDELEDLVKYPRISREDCYKIISNKLGTTYYNFESFKLDPLSEVKGFFGNYFQLQIKISHQEETKEFKFFAKYLPENETLHSMVEQGSCFEKEIFVYDILKKVLRDFGIYCLDNCTTTCYYNVPNTLEILEDLSDGYKALNIRELLTVDQLKSVLRKMVEFHAATWIFEEKMKEIKGSSYQIFDDYEKYLQEAFWLLNSDNLMPKQLSVAFDTIPMYLQLNKDHFDMPIKDVLEKWTLLHPHIYKILEPSKKFRNVICHGDFWMPNMLFNSDNDCKIIDFQLIRYCPPGHDILGLLYLTTDQSLRNSHMEELINFYYEELTKILKEYDIAVDKVYPYREFLNSLEYMRPQAIVQAILWRGMNLCSEEHLKAMFESQEIANHVYYVDRRDFLRDMYKKCSFYRKIMDEYTRDLYEVIKTGKF